MNGLAIAREITYALTILAFSAGAPVSAEDGTRLSFELSEGLGLADKGGTSRGVGWGDFDGDKYPDLIVSNTHGEELFLYRNVGGQRFERVTDGDLGKVRGHAQGVNWVDINNDGHLDLFVAREEGANLLFSNDGNGRLSLAEAGALTTDETQSVQGCWADFDRDGYLDVFIVNSDYQDDALYRNVDGSSFERVPGPWRGQNDHGRSCGWSDVDGDMFPDIYVANAYFEINENRKTAANNFYRNLGGRSFAQVRRGEFVNYHAYSYGVSWMDFDQDGDEDLFVSSIGRHEPNMLFENVDGQLFHPQRSSILVRDRFGPVKGHAWGDFDNDGDVDLFVAEGHGGARPEHAPFDNRDRMYENAGDGNYRVADLPAMTDHDLVSAGTAWADFDRDGDLDIFIANWGETKEGRQDNQLFRNTAAEGNWIVIALQGRESNRQGIGARVAITIDAEHDVRTLYRTLQSNSGYGSMNESILHFGLGTADVIQSIRIEWPSGQVDEYGATAANARNTALEGATLEPEPLRP